MNDFVYKRYGGGVNSKKYSIKPGPNFMSRRQAVFDAIRDLPSGKLIDIGCGMGAIAYEFYRKGYGVTGIEIETESIAVANDLFNNPTEIIDFRRETTEADHGVYDYVGSFEVIEHIADDHEFIKDVSKYLKPHGHIIISTPCHMSKWGHTDTWAGHVRRYEKPEIISLFEQNGFTIKKLYSYAFPIMNLSRFLYNSVFAKARLDMSENKDLLTSTKQSGLNREADKKFAWLNPQIVVWLFTMLGRLFYKRDWGYGYVVVAQKKD